MSDDIRILFTEYRQKRKETLTQQLEGQMIYYNEKL
jgi:hypothetical protein